MGGHNQQIQERSFNQSVSVSRRVNLPSALERDRKHIKSPYGGQGVQTGGKGTRSVGTRNLLFGDSAGPEFSSLDR